MTQRPEIKGGGILGENVQGIRRQLDTFVLPTDTKEVSYISDEVASYCPITGQPDWYVVEITLWESNLGLESKSLKLYLQSFNNPEEGQFCEAFCDRIAEDVYNAVSDDDHVKDLRIPGVQVILKQKPRGGISIEAVSQKGAWDD